MRRLVVIALVVAAASGTAQLRAATVCPDGAANLRPHFLGTPEIVAAYDLFKEGDAATALEALTAALGRMPAERPGRLPLHFLAGVVALEAGDDEGARRFLEIAAKDPVLGPDATVELGRIALRQGRKQDGERLLGTVTGEGRAFQQAQLSLRRYYERGRKWEAATEILRALVAKTDDDDLRMDLAEALHRSRERSEARAVAEEVWVRGDSRRAARRAEKLLARLSAAPSAVDRMVRFAERASPYNASALRAELKKRRRKLRGREARAAADFAEGVLLAQRRSTRERALSRFSRARKRSHDHDLEAWIALEWGTALDRLGESAKARKKLAEVLRATGHPAVAEARLRLATMEERNGNIEAALEAIAPAVELATSAATRAEVLWRTGWLQHQAGRHRAAVETFRTLRLHHGADEAEGEASTWEERAGYWEARALAAAGDAEAATELWTKLAAEHPLTYYGVLAREQLGPNAPELPPSVVDRDPFGSPADLSSLCLADAPQLGTAIALVRLGLYDRALRELRYRLARGSLPPAGVTLAGALLLRAGDLYEAHRFIRRYGRFARTPDAARETFWKLAYPLAFYTLAADFGRQFGVSPFLVLGLVRHESAFRTDAKSYAGARGLAQLMPRTARSVAERLLQISRPTKSELSDPAMNLLIATRFLAELNSLFRGNPALMVSAYNAGPGRVKGWWRDMGVQDTDVFLERMPYSATATYTKKVIAAAAAYHYLYGLEGEPRVLRVPAKLPEELGPYMVRDPNRLGPKELPQPALPSDEKEET